MLFYFDHLIQSLLLPPGIILLLAMFGFIFWRFKPLLGKSFMLLSFVMLWLFSTPIFSQKIIETLQFKYPSLSVQELKRNNNSQTAIVILEAGLNYSSREYNEPIVSQGTLERLRYGAFLYKQLGVPILVSGYDPSRTDVNQTKYMSKALLEYFNVPTKWKEDKAFNTAQEGMLTVDILKQANIKKIYLVTTAIHMPRAVKAFQNRGLIIIPAPTGYIDYDSSLGFISKFIPNMESLSNVSFAMREYIGLIWYKVHYGL